jgi:flavin reductase (DIM6/NTAB) family NADH-FMN oxidoreductase RutF
MDSAAPSLDFADGIFQQGSLDAPSWDARDLRNALGRFATGVTVVTARSRDGATAGVTVNSFCSVSLEPPLVLWCLSKAAPSSRVFLDATHFAIHVLAEHQAHLSARFSRPAPDKFAGLGTKRGLGSVPLLDDVVALFECSTDQRHDAGDHYIMLGRVERYVHTARAPLVFHTGAYRRLIGD